MLDYANTPLMFTYATSSNRWSTYQSPAIIFACMDASQHKEFKDISTVYKLAEHPLVKKIMGDTYFVRFTSYTKKQYSNLSEDIPKWIFHLDIQNVLENMDAGNHEKICLKLEDKDIGSVSTKQIFDECYLPQKYSMSCKECTTANHTPEQADSEHNCILKQMISYSKSNMYNNPVINNGISPDSLAEDFELKHGITKIDDFVYISPAMTGGAGVHQRVRGITEHFFTAIQEAADCRAEAQQERKRYVAFQKEVCTDCGVQKTCGTTFGDGTRRSCRGAYPKDQKEIVSKINDGVINPFTAFQLRYLLANSGTLSKRYNRCIVTTALIMRDNTLHFTLRRNTQPGAHNDINLFSDFKKAHEFILKHGNDMNGKYIAPLTPERLAILYEATSHVYSPTYVGTWHSTSYPVLYIEPYLQGFRINYSYHGRGACGFNMTLNSIQDIYSNFGHFTYLEKDPHVLRRY